MASYSLRVVFRAGGRDISRGDFAIDVGQGTAGPSGFPWVRLVLTLLLGVLVGALLPRAPTRRGNADEDQEDGGTPAVGGSRVSALARAGSG